MTALFHRPGEGQYLELALVDCLIAAQAPLISYYFATGRQPPRAGNGSIFFTPTGTFDTADRPLNICVINEKHRKQLCAALDRQDWLDDPRFQGNAQRVNHVEALDPLIAQVLKQKPAAHWLDRFHAAGVPFGLVYSYAEVFADPQVRHNGLLQEIPHPMIGTQKVVGLYGSVDHQAGSSRRRPPWANTVEKSCVLLGAPRLKSMR